MNIVFVGYRGTGKSTVARMVSKRLHRRLFSIDYMVTRATGKSIPQIVEEEGWPRFREMEAEQVRAVTDQFRNAVIDCGGGVVLNADSVSRLKQGGRVIWLTADTDEIIRRIISDPNRPALKEGVSFEEEQRQVLAEREPLYRAASDLVCDTTSTPPDDTASQVIRYFRDHRWI